MDANPYYPTLALVPDDVLLETATREFHMGEADRCLVGWLVRAGLARQHGTPAEDVDYWEDPAWTGSTPEVAARLFGGTARAWGTIFLHACHGPQRALIAEAFAQRVAEAAEAA
jgi:hypothetical protein